MITYAMPYLLNREPYNQVLNMLSFSILAGSVSFMTFTLTFAGVLQTHLQRVNGGGYMEVQDQLHLFYLMRLVAGAIVALGALLFIVATFVPMRREVISGKAAAPLPE